jgi:methionyl-tRNA synthetase
MPDATQKLWAALGASAGLGDLLDQKIPDQGQPGVLPVGSAVEALEPLFPRVEPQE